MSLDHLLCVQAKMVVPGVRSPGSIARVIRCGERVFLSGATATRADGSVMGLGDAAAQTEAVLDSIEAALAAAGGSVRDVTKMAISLMDRAHGRAVYETIGRRLCDVFPVGADHVVAGLARPELMVQIDAEAVIGANVQRLREFEQKDWPGQGIAGRGAMIAATKSEIFMCGLVGSAFDGSSMTGLGRRPEDAAAQADFALANLAKLLREAGSELDDVGKITVYIADRAYRRRRRCTGRTGDDQRQAIAARGWLRPPQRDQSHGVRDRPRLSCRRHRCVFRHLGPAAPCLSTLIVKGLASPELLMEVDIRAMMRDEIA
jgi:enamine deaminase RidA (YjgF/YER057c/UK114 family)